MNVLLTATNLLAKPFKNGKLINQRYEIVDFLGRGSYGNSYLVFDRKKQSQAVLKLLRMHKRVFKTGMIAFEQEQLLLQSLHHSSLPSFYEKGDIRGIPFFTMEFVNGKTFEQLIFQDGKTYSEKEAFQIGNQLLHIIDWLHKKGVVHRDIRIPNVMLEQNQLRLIDFGLSRRFDENHLPSLDLDHIKKMVAPISDFYAVGHFLLFLLYSNYESNENEQEKSWEEELNLTDSARRIIRKLLVIEEPYQSCCEIKQDILKI
jgi:serine/threonine protein kinase, bacterial